jgi:hypothetical protein
MEREGAIALLPAPLSETPRSEDPKKYIRNVEAVGSNPITSTKESPGQRTDGGSPRKVVRSKKGRRGGLLSAIS